MEIVEGGIKPVSVQDTRKPSEEQDFTDRTMPKTQIIPKSKSVDKELFKRVSPNIPSSQSVSKITQSPVVEQWTADTELVTHRGGCHCGAVTYETYAPEILTAKDCNCNLCQKKQMKYFTVPMKNFKLVTGHNTLTTYGTPKAKHNFCSVCGVETFFIPRDIPEGYAIVVSTVDGGSIRKLKVEKVNFKNKK